MMCLWHSSGEENHLSMPKNSGITPSADEKTVEE